MKLIIVDDNPDFREALKNYLELELNHTIIADVSNGKEFLELSLNDIKAADIILMDIIMDYIGGIYTTKIALFYYYPLRIIAITNDANELKLNQLIEAGFKGFIEKKDVFINLNDTLKRVLKGQYVFPKNLTC